VDYFDLANSHSISSETIGLLRDLRASSTPGEIDAVMLVALVRRDRGGLPVVPVGRVGRDVQVNPSPLDPKPHSAQHFTYMIGGRLLPHNALAPAT